MNNKREYLIDLISTVGDEKVDQLYKIGIKINSNHIDDYKALIFQLLLSIDENDQRFLRQLYTITKRHLDKN